MRALAALAILTATLVILPAPAGADTAQSGEASAFGAELSPIIPQTPTAASALADEDVSETLIDIPADPVAISGTLTATAASHKESDLASGLLVNDQGTPGPYNAVAFGGIESAEVLVDAVADDVSLVRADAVRAEAVAVCNGDTVTYSANSEIVNLDLGGEDVPLEGPTQQILDAVKTLLEETTLDQVVSVERNVVTESADGIAVDALRVEILRVANPAPIFVVLGHAELSGVSCGPDATPPECSDGVDNADPEDELADEDDPGCHTDGDPDDGDDTYDPNDDDETDLPECSDGVDNDDPEDDLADEDDPGCFTNGVYDPNDDDETDEGQPRLETPAEPALPRTGGDVPLAAAMIVGLGGLGALHLMRRRTVV